MTREHPKSNRTPPSSPTRRSSDLCEDAQDLLLDSLVGKRARVARLGNRNEQPLVLLLLGIGEIVVGKGLDGIAQHIAAIGARFDDALVGQEAQRAANRRTRNVELTAQVELDQMMSRPGPLFLEHPYDARREIRLQAAGPRRVAFLDLMRRGNGHGGDSFLNPFYKIRPLGTCGGDYTLRVNDAMVAA